MKSLFITVTLLSIFSVVALADSKIPEESIDCQVGQIL